ncbi:MAG: sigma 54-interacting transcriptional regulator [Gammaproteobacteria bacterium]
MTPPKLIEQFNLRARLRFDAANGHIWLDEHRMLLLHARAMGALRTELFKTLGPERARGLLARMGFASGQQDAELARKLLGSGDDEDVFRIGPQLHGFEGLVKSEIRHAEFDWERGSFRGEVVWENSWEVESHVHNFGTSDTPVCWTLIGYASGYVTGFFNRFIVFREVQCAGCGAECCVLEGKPAEDWGDDGYLDYFRADDLERELADLREELARLQDAVDRRAHPDDVVGSSRRFREAYALVEKAAASPVTVLLLGETGVGKEVFARSLHAQSARAERPFVAVNCAAIPPDLFEAELFGVRKGAFTGALADRPGRFERADGGTLFLDEVGDLPPAAQVKLLRVLQSGELERLGDEHTRRVDVRVVAATNIDLEQAVSAGTFRADLYYRLATYPVHVPPLRERRGDIPLLAAARLRKLEAVYHKKLKGLSDRGLQALMAYNWPGNVRELENIVERGVLLAEPGGWVEAEHLFAGTTSQGAPAGVAMGPEGRLPGAHDAARNRLCEELLGEGFDLRAHEERLLELAVARAGGNLARAARLLGLSRRQLAYRLRERGSSR